MQKILVTGGLGYIGSHTVTELLQAGSDVVIVDDLSNSTKAVLNGISAITGRSPAFYEGDIGDTVFMDEVMRMNPGITGVIHFAAFKAVGESVEKPFQYYRNNVNGLVNLLEVIARFNVNYFVFSSSCTVYGDTKDSPITEDHPVVRPNSPYGNTKKISEEILDDIAGVTDLKVISLRYFNPAGAHESALIGELPIGVPNNLVPYITQTATGIRKKLTVYGNDYGTPDGTCIRDYIHVVDLAVAHVRAIEYLAGSSENYTVFNIGTGHGTSVLEVVKTFEKVTGKKLPYIIGDRRPGDVEQIWADPERANKELGWKAERNIEDMMRSAWNWQLALAERQ